MRITGKEEALQVLLSDVENLLEDLYQSGFDTVHDSTLSELNHRTKQTAAYGMELLSGLLAQLSDGLAMRRHQMEKPADNLANLYAQLCWYISLCLDKIEIDKVAAYYKQEAAD